MICQGDGTGHFSPLPIERFDRYKVRGLNSVASVANAYDWDGDGRKDILSTGFCENQQFVDHNYSAGRTFIVTQSAEKLTEAPAPPKVSTLNKPSRER